MSNLLDLTEGELVSRNQGLVEVSSVLQNINIPFMLSDGVLLGAVRESSFIPWDWDVELSIKVEDIFEKSARLIELLKEDGFDILYSNLDYYNYKINVYKFHTKYSLVGFYKSHGMRLRKAYKYPGEFFDKTEPYLFLGNEYLVPSPPEKYLEYQYGDWRTPVKTTNKKKYLTGEVYRHNSLYHRLLSTFLRINNYLKSKVKRYFEYHIKIWGADREALFQYMYEYCILNSNKINIIEVGSSNGKEAALALKKLSNKMGSVYILEPDADNLNLAKKVISKYCSKKVEYFNSAVGPVSKKGEFYFSNNSSNLNSSIAISDKYKKVEVDYINIYDFLSNNNIAPPLMIKMDIEGFEVEVLNSIIDYLITHDNIFILFETHQSTYSKNRSMRHTLSTLFSNGYYPVMLESAGVRQPKLFKKRDMKEVMYDDKRGLYYCRDKQFVIDVCSTNIQENITGTLMTAKIVRSVLISRP